MFILFQTDTKEMSGHQARAIPIFGLMAIGFLTAKQNRITKAEVIGQNPAGDVLISKAIGKTAHGAING